MKKFKNKIICGDCIEVMKKMPSDSIDLVVTSPPYNVGIEYDGYSDRMSWSDYYKWSEKWLSEIYRVLKNDGRLALNHYLSCGRGSASNADSSAPSGRSAPLMEFNHVAQQIGFKHHSIAVWLDITLSNKTAWGSYLSASAPYINSPFEGILLLYKENWKKNNKGESDISKEDFINLTRGIWNIKTETHGKTMANFSIDLAKKCINLLSYIGDTVLDPFSGSGTTACAALLGQRNYVGIEQSQKYCDITEYRIKETKENICRTVTKSMIEWDDNAEET